MAAEECQQTSKSGVKSAEISPAQPPTHTLDTVLRNGVTGEVNRPVTTGAHMAQQADLHSGQPDTQCGQTACTDTDLSVGSRLASDISAVFDHHFYLLLTTGHNYFWR